MLKYKLISMFLIVQIASSVSAQDKTCEIDFSKYKFSCNLPCEAKLVVDSDTIIKYQAEIKAPGGDVLMVEFSYIPLLNPSIAETVAHMELVYKNMSFEKNKSEYKSKYFWTKLSSTMIDELFIRAEFDVYVDGLNKRGVMRDDYIYRSCNGIAMFSLTFLRGTNAATLSTKIYEKLNFKWDEELIQDTALKLNYTVPNGLFKLTSKSPDQNMRVIDCLDKDSSVKITVTKLPYQGTQLNEVKVDFFKLLKSNETVLNPYLYYYKNSLQVNEIQLFRHSEKVEANVERDVVNFLFTENNQVYRAEFVYNREAKSSKSTLYDKGLMFLASLAAN